MSQQKESTKMTETQKPRVLLNDSLSWSRKKLSCEEGCEDWSNLLAGLKAVATSLRGDSGPLLLFGVMGCASGKELLGK